MCGQSVQERLVRLNIPRNNSRFTQEEKDLVIEFYQRGFASGDGRLRALAATMNRNVPSISRLARELGLSDQKRKFTPEHNQAISARVKLWMSENPHPKGATGMIHSAETLRIMGEKSKAAWSKMTPEQVVERNRKMLDTKFAKYGTRGSRAARGSWKAGWRTIGGKKHYYRSRWEANYACYLEWLKQKKQIKEWETEPQVFWFEKIKRGVRSYLPDFRVTNLDGSQYYVEVKGWMDDRSRTTIKRMAKYYPDVKLEVVDSAAYKQLAKMGRLYGFE